MPTTYTYELWNGKKIVGTITLLHPIMGQHLVVPEVSMFKERYGRKHRVVTVPVSYRVVSDNHVDKLVRTVLDVRRKSKRQIAILTAYR